MLELIGVLMDDKECTMVAPWMENGSIVEFLREELEANPLKLARTVFCSVHLLTESGRSWRTPFEAFSTCIA